MKVFGIVGWSGSGKTTLLVELLPMLVGRGLRVSTVKHTHHGVDLDQPGKDTFRHREAGATEVVLASSARWALMHEIRDDLEPSLAELLSRLAPVDLVLIEGFKHHPHPKIEVFRRATGKPLLAPGDPHVVAVASDGPVPEAAVPVLDLNRPEIVAAFILAQGGWGKD